MAQEEIERLRPKPVQIGNYMEYRIKARAGLSHGRSGAGQPVIKAQGPIPLRCVCHACAAFPRPLGAFLIQSACACPCVLTRRWQTDGKRVLDNGSIVDVGERTVCHAHIGTTVTVGMDAFWVFGGALVDGTKARIGPRSCVPHPFLPRLNP